MKALTICQPYAHLILRGDKRVENRTWPTRHRGPTYIHAGKDRQWLTLDFERKMDVCYSIPIEKMHFGAVIGIANLIDCVHIDCVSDLAIKLKYPWLEHHEHTQGPWCWVFEESPAAIGPWPWKGAQRLFEIDDDALGKVANQALGISVAEAP